MSQEEHHHQKKKRVGKACDSCRIKKTKCDGKSPCSRCVADNKICAFVHKKKNKDKVHPSGYIEMLETRIEILTKSLKKLMVLSEPHLPFLQEIIENAKNDHSPESSPLSELNSEDECSIPINDVVSYLMSNTNMADLGRSSPDTDEASKSSPKTEGELSSPNRLISNSGKVPVLASSGMANINTTKAVKRESDLYAGSAHSRSSSSASLFSPKDDTTISNTPTQESLDTNSNVEAVEIFPRKSNSMFINNYTPYSSSQSPVSSLSNRLESHYLDEQSINSIRRSVSHKTHQRKNSGHVHKPDFVSHSHLSSSSSNFMVNNSNAFLASLSRSVISPNSIDPVVEGYTQEDVSRIDDEDYFSLESETLLNQPPSQLVNNDLSCYLDTELLSNNPFLT